MRRPVHTAIRRCVSALGRNPPLQPPRATEAEAAVVTVHLDRNLCHLIFTDCDAATVSTIRGTVSQ